MKQREWEQSGYLRLTEALTKVLLEEWGGPRSPMALNYIHGTIIPDLANCFWQNADLLSNITFEEIIQWKMKNQFANPSAVVADLAKDLLLPAQKIINRPQIIDPKEPWRRIFRLWIYEESLPNMAEKMGYPLDYLDLLLLRYKKVKAFIQTHRVSLLECLQNLELREYGDEQLSFLYQFHTSFMNDPLFRERLTLEQVIIDLGLPLQVSDLVALLEIIHTHEGYLDESDLIGHFSSQHINLFSCAIEGLTTLHYIQKNKAGKLTLSEKSARTVAGFLLPRLGDQLKKAIIIKDYECGKGILMRLNEEVLVKLLDWTFVEFNQEQIFELHKRIYKKISRRVDIHLLKGFANIPEAQELLLNNISDHDSLIRAAACQALGKLQCKEAIFNLIQLLRDPVASVKETAAQALGEIGTTAAIKELNRVVGDYGESVKVRECARSALKKIEQDN
ncbi:HEAT repeat protein [Desulfosporosinus acidiphilus SJ4]|uniref:HEAT repeat protein n=1 Tax=Desulfosporosinus acidiphilus (strain DSM 22704 / JCM 16185 / SJ4) TaxID=646529 RepID=I4D631_DESAJ|nr:HEAT repeat domain-containing protein [Desulfosporosinus acidiphilus]AFM41255.1 HEAT repeat protein [Desulfosporosinus acidiphilus SJ4]